MLVTVIGIAAYLPYALTARYIVPVSLVLATLYLVSFGLLGGLAAYRTERRTRDLFLRERQLDQERARSDGLLLNMLPGVIVEQLKTSSGGRIAQNFDQVSVFFADAVGSTEQAARSSPEAFADALDELFSHFDEIATRHGLEKIKTIGDAYMAVAGAPTPMADHADAAVGMAVDILAEAGKIRWPSGDPIVVRGGIATGPAVAGVIGVQRFAYDLWGDTVNLASRLETNAGPGQLPGLGVDGRRAGRSIRLRASRDPRGEGQGAHDRPRPAGPPRGRPRHGAARLRGRMTATRTIARAIRGRGLLRTAAALVVVCTVAAGCTDSDAGRMRRPSDRRR